MSCVTIPQKPCSQKKQFVYLMVLRNNEIDQDVFLDQTKADLTEGILLI